MKSKVHFVKKLCLLKDIDINSEEAQELYNLKIVQLLTEIKKFSPEEESSPSPLEEEDDDEPKSLAERLGCS